MEQFDKLKYYEYPTVARLLVLFCTFAVTNLIFNFLLN